MRIKVTSIMQSDLYTGQVWLGTDAMDLGLVDGVYTDMQETLKKELGYDELNLKQISMKSGFIGWLPGLMSSSAQNNYDNILHDLETHMQMSVYKSRLL